MSEIIKQSYSDYKKEDLCTEFSFMKIYISDLRILTGLSIAIYSYIQFRFNKLLGLSQFTMQELSKYLNVSLKNSREYIKECLDQLCRREYLSYLEFDGDKVFASFYDWDEQRKSNYVLHIDKIKKQPECEKERYIKMEYQDLIRFANWNFNLQKRESILKTYLAISSHMIFRDQYCFPSIAKISSESGVCERTVRSCIDIIKMHEYLYVWSGCYKTTQNKIKNTSNFYSFKKIMPGAPMDFAREIKDFKCWVREFNEPSKIQQIIGLARNTQLPMAE